MGKTHLVLVLGNAAVHFSYPLENVGQSILCNKISCDELTGHITGGFIILHNLFCWFILWEMIVWSVGIWRVKLLFFSVLLLLARTWLVSLWFLLGTHTHIIPLPLMLIHAFCFFLTFRKALLRWLSLRQTERADVSWMNAAQGSGEGGGARQPSGTIQCIS